MGKIAFVFAGQGAQYPGMGLELAQSSQAAQAVFDAVDAIRPGTSEQCFNGDESALMETKNTQPCMYAVETACAAVLAENGIKADMAAGFSLGEIGALAYTGVVDIETGFRLVCKRGELMHQAAELQETSMAAVLRLPNEKVEELCSGFNGVYPVNYNCPGQVSVAGLKDEMAAFLQAVKEAKGRGVPLKVNAGFHSPFMATASEGYANELENIDFSIPSIPLYSNCTGDVYPENTQEMKNLLSKQISSPVRWEQIIRSMIAAGADTFIELGPGQTLCGLIKKIDSSVRTYSVADKSGLDTVLSEVK